MPQENKGLGTRPQPSKLQLAVAYIWMTPLAVWFVCWVIWRKSARSHADCKMQTDDLSGCDFESAGRAVKFIAENGHWTILPFSLGVLGIALAVTALFDKAHK
jgi:hypothetical protein